MNHYLILRKSFSDANYKYKQYVVSTEKNIHQDRVNVFGYSLIESAKSQILMYPGSLFIRIPCVQVKDEDIAILKQESITRIDIKPFTYKVLCNALSNQRKFYQKQFETELYLNRGNVRRDSLWKTEQAMVIVRSKNFGNILCGIQFLNRNSVILTKLEE